jgi:DNA-binding transcriptional regulator YiaG
MKSVISRDSRLSRIVGAIQLCAFFTAGLHADKAVLIIDKYFFIGIFMPKRKSESIPVPLPVKHLLEQWGRAVRVQRQLAQLQMRDFAYRINVSLDTLQRVERGEPSVQASTYLNAMLVLGILDELCLAPDKNMVTTTRVRVRPKQKDMDDDYF